MLRLILILSFLIVPFVSQEGEGADKYRYDCGPANASMMIEHYTGIKVAPNTLMDVIGIDRYIHAGELQALMEDYGLETSVQTFRDIDEVIDRAPVIILMYSHWLLVTGGTENDIIYHDSLIGPNQHFDKDLMEGRWLWSGMGYQGIVVTKVNYAKLWELRDRPRRGFVKRAFR